MLNVDRNDNVRPLDILPQRKTGTIVKLGLKWRQKVSSNDVKRHAVYQLYDVLVISNTKGYKFSFLYVQNTIAHYCSRSIYLKYLSKGWVNLKQIKTRDFEFLISKSDRKPKEKKAIAAMFMFCLGIIKSRRLSPSRPSVLSIYGGAHRFRRLNSYLGQNCYQSDDALISKHQQYEDDLYSYIKPWFS